MIRTIIEVVLWIIGILTAIYLGFIGICKAIDQCYVRHFRRKDKQLASSKVSDKTAV